MSFTQNHHRSLKSGYLIFIALLTLAAERDLGSNIASGLSNLVELTYDLAPINREDLDHEIRPWRQMGISSPGVLRPT